MKITGHIEGLKKSELARLGKLYQRRVRNGTLFTYPLAEELCGLSHEIGRSLTVLVDAKGHIALVAVGSAVQLPIGDILDPPLSDSGLSDYYAVETSIGWQQPGQTDQAVLLQYHWPVLIRLMIDTSGTFSRQRGEHPEFCDGAILLTPELLTDPDTGCRQLDVNSHEPVTARQLENEPLGQWRDWGEEIFRNLSRTNGGGVERAVLIGIHPPGASSEGELADSLAELAQLAKTAGAQVLDTLSQSRSASDPKTYLGSGKARDLAYRIQQLQANVVIADDELVPAQQRTLEAMTQVKVIDRTELILDIFAQRAQSREGKIQVELAQLKYLIPRLRGRGRMFSQQTAVGAKGGIATRGPGETKLETDRRALQRRINQLEKEAEAVVKHRHFQRQSRQKRGKPLVSLVGYTNAGKSTLMNRLTRSGVLVEDKLFATLDPTTRKLYLASPDEAGAGREILLSDTVGFIQKLPTFLVKAFRATLEEAATADLLLHVWDISHPDRLRHLEAVQDVLSLMQAEMGVSDQPMWTVCNKIDQLPHWQAELDQLAPYLDHPVPVSARTGEGVPELLVQLARFFGDSSSLGPDTL